MKKPIVLIVGHSFQPSGIGVTLKNLFCHFPKESLGCVSSKYCEDDKAFSSFYLLGKSEVKLMFPFYLFERIKASKVIDNTEYIKANKTKLTNNGRSKTRHEIYKKILQPFLKYLKLYIYRSKLKVSDELIAWVKKFQPDIIYTALGSLSMMKFVLDLHIEIPEAKLVVHIMDDWISTQSEQVLFSNRYENSSNYYFQEILSKSSIRFVISEKMAEDYSKRFRRTFLPFHNPVNISDYINNNNEQKKVEEKRVTYVGKINNDNFDVINDMIDAIERLNTSENRIKFFIYTPTDPIFIKQHIIESSNLIIEKAIPHKQIPAVLCSSDILFLPLSFKEKSKKYTRLSISTKITEYMASKKPIIVYAPYDIALTEYVNRYGVAYTVSDKKINLLINTIQEILNNSHEANEMANRAFLFAKEKHSIEKVSTEFKRVLTEI